MLSGPGTKYLWANRHQLAMKEGVLYYRWETNSHPRYLLVVPESLKPTALKYCHDHATAGHLGQDKTLARLQQRFIWYRLRTECKEYVQTCGTCNKNKKPCRAQRGPLGQYHAGMPVERVHLDILGPLPASDQGNTCILVIIDQFTKWVECYPIQDQKAEVIANKFVNDFVARFGCPQFLHTDQGRNVDGNLIRSICHLLQVHKTRTTPYHPSSNGQVERYNRTILQMVRCFLEGKSRQWDRHLHLLAGALRTVPHRTTGFSPNMMMLGREVVQPEDIVFGIAKANNGEPEPTPEYVRALRRALGEVHSMARERLKTSQQLQKRMYDQKLTHTKYEVGDLVYRRDTANKKGQSPKLKPVWKGPYLVEEVLSPVLVRIGERRKSKVVHHDRVILCRDRTVPLWLRRRRHRLLERGERLTNATLPPIDENEGEDLGLDNLLGEGSVSINKVREGAVAGNLTSTSEDRAAPNKVEDRGTGPSGPEVTEGDTTAHPPVTSNDTLKPSRGHEDDNEPSELEQATPDGAGTVTKKRVKQAKRQKKKPVKTTAVDQPERLTRRGRLIRVPARLQNSVRRLLHLFN